MSAAKWILNLWPGLPQLWWRGTWQSLSVAVAFTALLNGALLTSFVESVRLSPWIVVGLWVAVCMACLGACLSRLFDPSEVVSREAKHLREALFQQAQTQYLKGHWFQAEKLVSELLKTDSTDPEARLLLASIFRRSDRAEQAAKLLSRLAKCSESLPWHLEIEQELQRITLEQVPEVQESTTPQATEEESAGEPNTLAFPRNVA